jgi:hypothetical protein
MSAEFNPATTPLYKLRYLAARERREMQQKHKAWIRQRYEELWRQRDAAVERRRAAAERQRQTALQHAALQKLVEAQQAAEALGLKVKIVLEQPEPAPAAAAGGGAAEGPKRPLSEWQTFMKRTGAAIAAADVHLVPGAADDVRALARFCSETWGAVNSAAAAGRWSATPDGLLVELAKAWNLGRWPSYDARDTWYKNAQAKWLEAGGAAAQAEFDAWRPSRGW